MDLRGRTIRTGRFAQPEGVHVQVNDCVEFRTDGLEIESTKEEIQISFYDLPPVMREGDLISFGDNGQVRGTVKEVSRTSFSVLITAAGYVKSNSAIKVPGNRIQQLPCLQLQDKLNIKEIAIKNCFDYIVVPAVQTGRDIQEIKLLLGHEAAKIQIVAKIDSIDAVQNFESIVKQADGVVILRNELSFQLEPEKLMIAQKWMTQTANLASIPVFLQSQVLESTLTNNIAAARLETQDVSAAVIEGADVFILSHETSTGPNAVDATILLAKSIAEAENVYDHEQVY